MNTWQWNLDCCIKGCVYFSDDFTPLGTGTGTGSPDTYWEEAQGNWYVNYLSYNGSGEWVLETKDANSRIDCLEEHPEGLLSYFVRVRALLSESNVGDRLRLYLDDGGCCVEIEVGAVVVGSLSGFLRLWDGDTLKGSRSIYAPAGGTTPIEFGACVVQLPGTGTGTGSDGDEVSAFVSGVAFLHMQRKVTSSKCSLGTSDLTGTARFDNFEISRHANDIEDCPNCGRTCIFINDEMHRPNSSAPGGDWSGTGKIKNCELLLDDGDSIEHSVWHPEGARNVYVEASFLGGERLVLGSLLRLKFGGYKLDLSKVGEYVLPDYHEWQLRLLDENDDEVYLSRALVGTFHVPLRIRVWAYNGTIEARATFGLSGHSPVISVAGIPSASGPYGLEVTGVDGPIRFTSWYKRPFQVSRAQEEEPDCVPVSLGCPSCSGEVPEQLEVTIKNLADANCENCSDLDGTYIAQGVDSSLCRWHYIFPDASCNAQWIEVLLGTYYTDGQRREGVYVLLWFTTPWWSADRSIKFFKETTLPVDCLFGSGTGTGTGTGGGIPFKVPFIDGGDVIECDGDGAEVELVAL